ncbi:hypothetical protein [uncultured Salinisphaera sp.]|uniref:hypothetical protein n=1 Tax=uncultured Salinisphaera sp. TaxID=359372 RepID=UPI0032B20345|tara:strand:- start:10218 stop:10970 length:753 start_codon:yes stop_codon:yes gene_type:complete
MSQLAWARLLIVLGLVAVLTACAGQRSVDRQGAAESTANIGAEYLRQGDNERAQTAFERALTYDRDNFTANWGMAVVSDRMNAAQAAQRYFEDTLAIRDLPAVYNSYAAFLCRHDQPDRGVENFRYALAADSAIDRADTLANAGLCLARADKRDQAADYFEQALAIDGEQATALTQMAEIAYHERHYMRARAFIERADSATQLSRDQLRLAADIERALDDPAAARAYMTRYSSARPADPSSTSERETSQP